MNNLIQPDELEVLRGESEEFLRDETEILEEIRRCFNEIDLISNLKAENKRDILRSLTVKIKYLWELIK